MHGIVSIEIENYKSCLKTSLRLSDFTPIVGYNNGGKSNIMQAIKWCIRPTSLAEDYFNNPNLPLSVSMEIQGISDEILDRLDQRHRTRIEQYVDDGTLWMKRSQSEPNSGTKGLSLHVRSAEGKWDLNPTGIDGAIKAIYPEPIEIGAMENATEDVGKWKTSTTIGKLISEVISPIEEQHGQALSHALEGIRKKLSADGDDRAPELNQLDTGANRHLAELFPNLSIKVHVPPPEIKDMFKGGTIKVFEGPDGIGRDVSALGHGAQRSIQMALMRYLAELKRVREENPARTVLLVDEPELYLHPHGIEQVRIALKLLSQAGYQVVFASHSPLMIKKDDVANTLIVYKDDVHGSICRPRIADKVAEIVEGADTQADILFEFSNLSQVLFNDRVIVVEGKTEKKLLPDVYERIRGSSLASKRIGMASPSGSGGIQKCLEILNAMGLPSKGLVDIDFAFKTAPQYALIDSASEDFVRAKEIISIESTRKGFDISEDGFPKKSPNFTAAEAYEELVKENAEFSQIVIRFHNLLKASNIWLWTRGAIEKHLGITGKTNAIQARFVRDLLAGDVGEVINDVQTFEELFAWIEL